MWKRTRVANAVSSTHNGCALLLRWYPALRNAPTSIKEKSCAAYADVIEPRTVATVQAPPSRIVDNQ